MTLALFFVTIRAYDIATDLGLFKYKYGHKLKAFSSNDWEAITKTKNILKSRRCYEEYRTKLIKTNK